MPHLAGATPAQLLAANPSRRRLLAAFAEGAGQRWTAALRTQDGSREGPATPGPSVGRRNAAARGADAGRGADAMRAALDEDGVTALGEQLAELQAPVATWLAALSLLEPLPFANLVPAEAMLPAESLRFFYVDRGWLTAAAAGALSVGIHSNADVTIAQKLQPSLEAAVAQARREAGVYGPPLSGLLVRSALVPSWPTLVIAASRKSTPVQLVRRETRSPDVLLCLWADVPDEVSLAEPYQGLRFGIESSNHGEHHVALRDVTTTGAIGSELSKTVAVAPLDGRIDVATLASTIAGEMKISALGAGNLAIQLVLAPEQQLFPTPVGTRG